MSDNPMEEAASNPQDALVVTTPAPPSEDLAKEGTPEPAPVHAPEATPPTAPLPTTAIVPLQSESCPTATTKQPAQPDLTTEPTIVPLAEPTPKPKPFEPLHTDETSRSVEIEPTAPYLPPITTPTTDPAQTELSILHIFDDA